MSPKDLWKALNYRYAPHRRWQVVVALPVLGLVIAFMGPFGSYGSMDLWARAAHFSVCLTVIGTGLLEGNYLLARRFFAGLWPLWAALLFDVLFSFPAAALVYGSLSVLGPEALPHVRFSDLIWQNLLITLMIRAGVMTSAMLNDRRLSEVDTAPSSQAEAAPSDTFLSDRLPFALKGAQILALSSEDHYLRVYTLRGEALVHMTMAEATERLRDGFQIHRSHWISAAALKDHDGISVHLMSGLCLPVSRQRRKAFADWLAQAEVRPA